MKVKVSDAERETLDWMVAMAEGLGLGLTKENRFLEIFLYQNRKGQGYCYSRSWLQGGPIIEREKIAIKNNGDEWSAKVGAWVWMHGPTPLIAAMRCFVASRLGDEVDVPDDLVWDELIYDKGDE